MGVRRVLSKLNAALVRLKGDECWMAERLDAFWLLTL